MAKSLAASKKVMKNYLSELLTDNLSMEENAQQELSAHVESKPVEDKGLEALLKNVNANLSVNENEITTKKSKSEIVEDKQVIINESRVESKLDTLITHKSSGSFMPKEPKPYRQGNFQALFFNVGGLTVAVPLIELGGIHNIDKTTALIGKPDWYKGVMLQREEKINVVDTALWIMPEKCDEKMKSSLNYQYVIMLSDSSWGLTAEDLVDTVVLTQDEVKWLDNSRKRPWLAGLVKDKMCALVDVSSLIQLLNDGSGIHQDD